MGNIGEIKMKRDPYLETFYIGVGIGYICERWGDDIIRFFQDAHRRNLEEENRIVDPFGDEINV